MLQLVLLPIFIFWVSTGTSLHYLQLRKLPQRAAGGLFHIRAFSYQALFLWNYLTADVWQPEYVESFKLKTRL